MPPFDRGWRRLLSAKTAFVLSAVVSCAMALYIKPEELALLATFVIVMCYSCSLVYFVWARKRAMRRLAEVYSSLGSELINGALAGSDIRRVTHVSLDRSDSGDKLHRLFPMSESGEVEQEVDGLYAAIADLVASDRRPVALDIASLLLSQDADAHLIVEHCRRVQRGGQSGLSAVPSRIVAVPTISKDGDRVESVSIFEFDGGSLDQNIRSMNRYSEAVKAAMSSR